MFYKYMYNIETDIIIIDWMLPPRIYIYIYIYKAQGNYIYTCIKERDIKNTLSIEYNLNKKHNDNQKLFFTSLHTIIFWQAYMLPKIIKITITNKQI